MSTPAPQPTASFREPGVTLDVSGTKPIPFGRIVAVELRKMVDTRAGQWLLGISVGLAVVAELVALWVFAATEAAGSFEAFTGAAAFTMSFLLPVLGILLVTQEWGQRTAVVTFALDPRRLVVVAGKLVAGVVLTLVVVVVSFVVGALCTVLCSALDDQPVTWDLSIGLFAGFTVAQVLSMLVGFAFATLLLSTPLSITVYFVWAFVLPVLFNVAGAFLDWFNDIVVWIDFSTASGTLAAGDLTGEDWAHLVVSGILWLAIPGVLGLRRIATAETK